MPNIHDTNRKRGMPFRLRYAEDWNHLAVVGNDRISMEKRLKALEADEGLADTAADRIRNNRRGLENRFRAIEGDL